MSGKPPASRIATAPEHRPANAPAGLAGERAWAPKVPAAPRPARAQHSFGDLRVTAGGAPLVVGKPDDAYEIEAERAADRALADGPREGAASGLTPARPGLVQRRANANTGATTSRDLPQQIGSAAGEARPLPATQRTFFEQRLGHDFGTVRIHEGPASAAAAASVGAQAFAHGQNVYFGAGEYRPDSRPGQWLIAHELAHTVQQRPNVIARRALDGAATADAPLPEGEAPVAPSASPEADREEAGSQSPRATADEIEGLLTSDPSDTSGQARGRVKRLPPGARGQVATAVAAKQDESPMRREGHGRVVASKRANPPMADDALPKAVKEGQGRKPKPGTPQARAEQLAAATPPPAASVAPPVPAIPDVRPDRAAITRGGAPAQQAKPAAAPSAPAPDSRHAERGGSAAKRDAAVSRGAGGPSAAQPSGGSSAPGGGAPSEAMSGGADDRPLRLADLFKQGTPKPRTESAAAGAPGAESDVDEGSLLSPESGSALDSQRDRSDEAQMQSLAAQLEGSLAATRENMQTQSATIGGRVRQQAAASRASIRADVTQAVQKIQNGQNSLLSDISSTVATTHALIDASLAIRKVEATGKGLTGQQDIRGVFSGHRDAVGRTVNDNVEAADKLSKDKKEDVQKRNRADIRTAYHKGGVKLNSYPGTMRGAYIGGAAFDVAEGLVNDMRDQETDIVNAVGETTAPMPAYFRAQGAKALDGFDVNLPKILASVDVGVAKAHGDQDQRAADAHAKLNALANRSRAEIDMLALTAVAQTVAFGPQLETKLDQELGRVLRAIAATPDDVMRRIAPAIEEAITLFRSSEDPDVEAAKELADRLAGFLDRSAASTGSVMQQAADTSEERLQVMRGGARAAMSAQVERSNKAWQGSRAGFTAMTGALHANADDAFAAAVALLAGALKSTQDSIGTQLAPVVDNLAGSFADARRQAEAKIDGRIDEGMAKNTEALGKLDGAMAEAASDAAYEFDHPILSSLETGLKFLAGLIAGLLIIIAGLAFFLLIGWAVAGLLGLVGIAVSVAEAGLLVMAFTIGYALGSDFGQRLAAGQSLKDAALGALGDFPGMLYDMTGIPKIVKGFSDDRLTPFDRGKEIGEGLGQLVLTVLMLRAAPKGIAGLFKEIPPSRPPIATLDPVALPEGAAPRAPVEPPATPGPAPEAGVPRPTERPVSPPEAPATAATAPPEPTAAPRASAPQVAAESAPPARPPPPRPPTTVGPEPAGEPGPARGAMSDSRPTVPQERVAPEPEGEAARAATDTGPPEAEADTPRIGPGREAVRAEQPRPPGAEPDTPRIGPGREAVRAAQPRPPGAEPDTPTIGFGREAARAARSRPSGAEPDTPTIGFGREAARAARSRPTPSQGPVASEGGSFTDLRGTVVESGQPAGGTTVAAGESAGAGGRSPVDIRASAEPPGGAGGPRAPVDEPALGKPQISKSAGPKGPSEGAKPLARSEAPKAPEGRTSPERPQSVEEPPKTKGPEGPRQPGSRVTHEKFGDGTVISEANGKTRVRFDNGSEKTILSERLQPTDRPGPAEPPAKQPRPRRKRVREDEAKRGLERSFIRALKERFPKLKELDIRPKRRPRAGRIEGAPEFAFEERMQTSQGNYSYEVFENGKSVIEFDGISDDGWIEEIKINQSEGKVADIVGQLRDQAAFAKGHGLNGVRYSIDPPSVQDLVEAAVAEARAKGTPIPNTYAVPKGEP